MPNAKIIHDSSKLAAGNYLSAAIRDIDAEFGEGYARAHPELVAAFMQTAVMDYSSGIASESLHEAISQIRDALDAIASALESVADQIGAE